MVRILETVLDASVRMRWSRGGIRRFKNCGGQHIHSWGQAAHLSIKRWKILVNAFFGFLQTKNLKNLNLLHGDYVKNLCNLQIISHKEKQMWTSDSYKTPPTQEFNTNSESLRLKCRIMEQTLNFFCLKGQNSRTQKCKCCCKIIFFELCCKIIIDKKWWAMEATEAEGDIF